MKITLITDVHEGAPNEIKVQYNPMDKDEYLLGDIVDLANCTIGDVPKYKRRRLELKAAYNQDKLRYIDGNHCRIILHDQCIRLFDRYGKLVVMYHGDYISWGAEKSLSYRSKKLGASFFKRQILVRAIEQFEETIGRRLTDVKLDMVKKAKADGASTIIIGHCHPKETIDEVIQGVRIIILKRGRSEVDL